MTKIEILRNKIGSYYSNGKMLEALNISKKMLKNSHYAKKVILKDKINDLIGMFNMCGNLGLYDEAIIFAKKSYNLDKNNFISILQLSRAFYFIRNYEEAIKYAEKAKKINSDNLEIYDILADSYMRIKDFNNAKKAGIKALSIKEIDTQNYTENTCIDDFKIKVFNKNDKSRNVISFSLFGDSPKYCENAVINAELVSKIYPHWSCRFYCSTDVPDEIIKRLKDTNAEIIIKEKEKDIEMMLFWRFLVMSDENIDRYLVRDCDSIINEKEAYAVEDWINSNKVFHIMRDCYTHTELILAGMFGGITGIFENIENEINIFSQQKHIVRSHLDQLFLRQIIWPCIKSNVIIHDSCFNHETNNYKKFPKGYNIKENFNIGMYDGVILNIKLNYKTDKKFIKWAIEDKGKNIICTYTTKLFNNTFNIEIPRIYADKLQSKEYSIKPLRE